MLPNIPLEIPPKVKKQLNENSRLQRLPAQIAEASTAEQVYLRLKAFIEQYQDTLDSAQDVAVQPVNFGQSTTIAVDSMGYSGYDLILFMVKDFEKICVKKSM